VVFIESRPFTRKLELPGESADQLLRAIQSELLAKPELGAMVPGLGGGCERPASPIRYAAREGGRIPLPLPVPGERQHIHLLILLDKNEQEDATEEQRKQIRKWVAQVKSESRG